jgi:hypothetical protein
VSRTRFILGNLVLSEPGDHRRMVFPHAIETLLCSLDVARIANIVRVSPRVREALLRSIDLAEQD